MDMKSIVSSYIGKFLKDRTVRRKFLCIFAVLASIVVVCVFWQLHSVGSAYTDDYKCGLEEHVHTMEAGCYEQVLICGLEEGEGAIDAQDAVYEKTDVLICDLEENEEHTHSSDCYETRDVLVSEAVEGSEGHIHTDECYEWQITCTIPEHTHSDECFVEDTTDEIEDAEITDELEESSEENEISEADVENEIADAVDDQTITYIAEDGGVLVKVVTDKGVLPDDAKLYMTLYDEDSSEYIEASEAVGLSVDGSEISSSNGLIAFDIYFMVDGQEVEPNGYIDVSLDASAVIPDNIDITSVVVSHLEESDDGVTAVTVASANTSTEGTFDTENKIANFKVNSLSKFTITWDDGNNPTTVTVRVFNMSGNGIEETLDVDYTHDGGDIKIDDIITHLHETADVSSYHFEYAIIYYEVKANEGYSATTLGSEDNPVVEISRSASGTSEIYRVTLKDNTSTTLSDPEEIYIELFYSIPTVELSVIAGDHSNQSVTFTSEMEYFKGLDADDSDLTYTWIMSASNRGSIKSNDDGTAVFTWDKDNVSVGDKESITLIVTNTYTADDGTTVTETAQNTYNITYGETAITVTVYQHNSTTDVQENARVALVDSNGDTVSTGITDSNGNVTLYATEGTYTVGITYVVSKTGQGPAGVSRSTVEGSISVNTDGSVSSNDGVNVENNTVKATLGEALSSTTGSINETGSWNYTTPYYYEHIDVKEAVTMVKDQTEVFSSLDAVYVYDKYGNLLYVGDDLITNGETTDYNCKFDINGDENQHGIVVSSEDTVIIVFELDNCDDDGNVISTKTYTLVLKANDTYSDGEYYSYDDINAYQLYNTIYSASVKEDEWNEALESGEIEKLLGNNYNENGIPIGGLTYIQVADYLCDTRTMNNQAGLDFVIEVGDAEVFTWNFAIAKSYNISEDIFDDSENFTFTMYDATMTSRNNGTTWTIDTNDDGTDATTGTWTKEDDGTYSSLAVFESKDYEAFDNIYYYVLTEDETSYTTPEADAYGIIVSVEYTNGILTIDYVSRCKLEANTDEDGNVVSYTQIGNSLPIERDSETGMYIMDFGNTYNAETDEDFNGITIEKQDMEGNGLEGAAFKILKEVNESEDPTDLTTYYYSINDSGEYEWVTVDDIDDVSSVTVDDEGIIRISDIENGDVHFTLTETNAPDGYKRLVDSISFTVTDGEIDPDSLQLGNGDETDTYLSLSNDNLTLTVKNSSNAILPEAGGIGVETYIIAGLVLIALGTVSYIYINRRKKSKNL